MEKRYYNGGRGRMVIARTEADADYWDNLWEHHGVKKYVTSAMFDPLVTPLTKRFLKRGSRVLEGGCGRGQFVYRLRQHGFDAVGVDYAERTVKILNKEFPDMPVVLGDVRKLPFKDGEFDGYWSLGVIEHFYDGYDEILAEMHRVLRVGGFVFITFPHMNPLRRLLARTGRYTPAPKRKPKGFYQFILPDKSVIRSFEKAGFRLRRQSSFDGLVGLRQECKFCGVMLRPLTRSRLKAAAAIRYALMVMLKPLSSHVAVLVFEKTADKH